MYVPQVSPNDISFFCRRTLKDDEKTELLENVWVPDNNFKFPVTGERNLKFQPSWLRSFPWLTYSAAENGAYCQCCVLFAPNFVGKGRNQTPQLLVTRPFQNWNKAMETFQSHQKNNYHKDAFVDLQSFQLVIKNKQDLISELDKNYKDTKIQNRKKLQPIIRTVLFCARQGVALRGHQDHGLLATKIPKENNGNFRALLRFALESNDNDLKSHLETANRSATYLSPRIQNEIIEVAGKIIVSNLVKRINEARCFTVIADESTDVSGIEQLTLCVRFVENQNGEYRIQDFLQFGAVNDVTERGLANTLLTTLKRTIEQFLMIRFTSIYVGSINSSCPSCFFRCIL